MNKRRIVEAPVWETGVKGFGQDVITILKNNSTFLHWGPILAILMVFTVCSYHCQNFESYIN